MTARPEPHLIDRENKYPNVNQNYESPSRTCTLVSGCCFNFHSVEVWHHGHIMMQSYCNVFTKGACCHCRSVYGIPNASILEVTLFCNCFLPILQLVPALMHRISEVNRGFHPWLQIHRYASLVPRPSPAQFSWLHTRPLNHSTSPGSSNVT